MKKALSIITLLCLLALSPVFSGCGRMIAGTEKEGGEDGRVTLEFWTFWGSETRRPVIEKIVDDFNKSQDKIYVKHIYLPFGDIWTKELAAVAAGNPPDIVMGDILTVRHRAQKNQAENLSSYIKEDPSVKDRFLPQAWEAIEYEGGVYALPFNLDTRILFYNKDLLKEEGLDPDRPPKTWEELREYSDKLDVKKGDKYERIGFYPLWDVNADVWAINADGKFFFDENEKPIINTPENVEALRWIKSFREKYGLKTIDAFQAEFGKDGNELAQPFISGKVAIFGDIPGFYTQIRDYGKGMNFGVAPLPEREPGTGHWSWSGGFVAEIPKGAKHPEEAFEFIKYLTDEKAQAYWGKKNFDIMANEKANNRILSQLSGDAKKVFQVVVDNIPQTVFALKPIKAPDFENLVKPEFEKAIRGSKTPEKALEDAQKAVEKLTGNHR